MTRKSYQPLFLALALVSMVAAGPLMAQNPKRPQAYTLTGTMNSPMMGNSTFKVYRNGPRELVDLSVPAGMDSPTAIHQIILFNLQAHKAYAQDPASHECFSTPYTSEDALKNYDPFEQESSLAQSLPGAKLVGTETVNGLATKVYEAKATEGPGAGSDSKMWWSDTYDLPIKTEARLANSSDSTPFMTVELRIDASAPPASLFSPPTGCKEAEGQWTPEGFELRGEKTVTLGAVAAPPAKLQPSPLAAPSSLPTQYTLAVVSTANDASMVTGRPATLKVYRNGSKERVDVTLPPGGGGSGFYGIYLFDFSAQKVYQAVRIGNSSQSPWSCQKYPSSEARYGDDPVTDSADIWEMMAKMGTVKKTGAETLNGIPTEVEEVTGEGFPEKIWIDQKRRFIVKYSGPMNMGYEVKQMNFAPPSASLLATPASCQYTGDWCRSGFCGGTGSASPAPAQKPKQ